MLLLWVFDCPLNPLSLYSGTIRTTSGSFKILRSLHVSTFRAHNAALCGCFVAPAEKQSDNSALLQLVSIVAYCYN